MNNDNGTMIRLLLVEDDANLCYIIRGGLEDMIGGYEVVTADNGETGLKIWKEAHPDVIVADIGDGWIRNGETYPRNGRCDTYSVHFRPCFSQGCGKRL